MEEFKYLGFNIKKYRKNRNFTQAQLAAELCVTAQNVSKWEKSLSMPDIGNLCKLSQLFSVSLEELLGLMPKVGRCKTMVAVDGGGTKTEFVLFRETGEVIRRILMPGTNPNSCGLQTTLSILKNGIEDLMLENSDICSVYTGIAGCGSEENRKRVLSVLKKNYPNCTVKVCSDVLNAINCTPSSEKTIAVICGTGSVVYAKTPTELHQVGGWGYIFDSGGSGYDFGRDAICAALAQRDGIGEKTFITELVEERLNGNVADKINTLYANGKDYIASFSQIVFEAFKAGDRVSERIIDSNTSRLAFLIENAAKLYDCGNTAVISGGLVTQKEILEKCLTAKSGGAIQYIFNELPQIFGASINCCKMISKDAALDAEFKRCFLNSYNKLIKEGSYAEN